MKNTMKLGSTPKTVPQQELIDAMQVGTIYSQAEVMDLLPDHPRVAVRDTLHVLVEKGIVWREARKANKDDRVRYSLLQGEALQEAIERKTTRSETPAWMKATLTGFDAQNTRFREMCEATRK